jgi:hypothetical protein
MLKSIFKIKFRINKPMGSSSSKTAPNQSHGSTEEKDIISILKKELKELEEKAISSLALSFLALERDSQFSEIRYEITALKKETVVRAIKRKNIKHTTDNGIKTNTRNIHHIQRQHYNPKEIYQNSCTTHYFALKSAITNSRDNISQIEQNRRQNQQDHKTSCKQKLTNN